MSPSAVQSGLKGGPRCPHALLVEFETAEALLAAARQVRDAGYTMWDAHSPYPVHGLDKAVGIRPTKLPWLVFLCGLTGAGLALLMQWWMNAVDFPFIISGKPFFSLPANIPIIFELTVLLAAFGATFGMLAFNGLPKLYNGLFHSARFQRVSTDRFFIHIEAADPKFDEARTAELLEALSSGGVERIEECGYRSPPRWLVRVVLILVLLTLIPIVVAARARAAKSASPRIHVVQDMDNQEKFKPQHGHPLFADGRAMRPLAVGTVARGELRDDDHYYRGKIDDQWATSFPIHREEVAITQPFLQRGRERFNIFCAACHGLSGRGDGPTAVRAAELEEPNWVAPTSLHDQQVRERPVGQLFNTITNGIRTMPTYGDQIPEADRWAIVAYIRALQRSTNARREDIPPAERAGLER